MQQQRLDRLRALRLEIAALSVVKCRMTHERVVRDSETGLPVMCRFPEGAYRRIGLCTPEIRAERLGCSHTFARVQLKDAIKELDRSSGEHPASDSSLSGELARLDNAVHLLDHRKGDAEKRLAQILDEAHRDGDNEEKVKEAENEICGMEQLHDGYVEELGRLRNRVIAEIDRLLIELTPANQES